MTYILYIDQYNYVSCIFLFFFYVYVTFKNLYSRTHYE